MNKKGWIKIVEAFIAVLLIAGTVLIIITREDTGEGDISNKIYKLESSILREIQLNDSLRADVLGDFVSQEINNTIENKIPDYLECRARICSINSVCRVNVLFATDVYAQSTIISANLTTYNPKQLKLFCWGR